jgi:hypothetical protein
MYTLQTTQKRMTKCAGRGAPQFGAVPKDFEQNITNRVPKPIEQEYRLAAVVRGIKLRLQKRERKQRYLCENGGMHLDALQVLAVAINGTAKSVHDDAVLNWIHWIINFRCSESAFKSSVSIASAPSQKSSRNDAHPMIRPANQRS